MPTPFTHLAVAQRLLDDPSLALEHRELFRRELGAFLLGNVAADARNESGSPRAATHFYDYAQDMDEHMPWEVMLQHNPSLWEPHDEAHTAFVAGYVAHLSMDEIWSRQMVGPQFLVRDWATRSHRWVMLHVILIHMDERDERQLAPWQAESLAAAEPHGWTHFLSDASLSNWRDLVADQIRPGGHSQTLEIFGARANRTPEQLRALLDNPSEMDAALWQFIPQQVLASTEADMYSHALTQTAAYLAEARIPAR